MARKPTAQRQLEIEQAVLDLIAADGTQGITMTRIAARIGVSEAALYRHFHGKLGWTRLHQQDIVDLAAEKWSCECQDICH